MRILVVLLAVAVAAHVRHKNHRNHSLRAACLAAHGQALAAANRAFAELVTAKKYLRYSHHAKWRADYADLENALRTTYRAVANGIPEAALFLKQCKSDRADIDARNKIFVEEAIPSLPPLLQELRIPFNDDQLRAIVTEADNTLLVAGAGTGKTTTIEGKVAYLTRVLNVPPEDILMLSFTKKATGELIERVAEISPGLEIRTFHGFGLSVIGEALGRRPSIAFENDGDLEKFVGQTFTRLLADSEYARLTRDYFAYFLTPEAASEFETLDEYYAHLRLNAPLTARGESARSGPQVPADPKAVSQFVRFVANFITLFKSGHASLDHLWETAVANDNPREAAFLKLFKPIYLEYERNLQDSGRIDFNDMLGRAAELIANGAYKKRFSHVIVDEYQDVSVSKYMLIKAIRRQNPDCLIYCVGDDWQSIYRFAGSDVSLMSEFEQHFGPSVVLKLEVSNRFSNDLAKLTNDFVQRNPSQIKKTVRSGRSLPKEPLQVLYGAKSIGFQNESILAALDAEAERVSGIVGKPVTFKVFLLGRYGLEKCEHVNRDLLLAWQRRFPRLAIEFMTMHSSKGLTADFAILQDVNRGTVGIPCEIVDDPLLHLVLKKPEPFPFAEERRVMYVGLTRAKHKVWVLTSSSNPSPFIRELAGPREARTGPRCPRCGGRLAIRKGKFGTFISCSNFPRCAYKTDGVRLPSPAAEPRSEVRVPDMLFAYAKR